MNDAKRPFIRRVILKNYKSIGQCDVELGPLTLLVGPNGSGKSNFLDAIHFMADCVDRPIGHVLRDRGGISRVCRLLQEDPPHFSIELHIELPDERQASLRFVVEKKSPRGFRVREEECRVWGGGVPEARYRLHAENIEAATFEPTPLVGPDRLYLTVASSFPEFRPLFDFLAQIRFYNIDPEQIRRDEPGLDSDRADTLQCDGGDATNILRGIKDDWAKRSINEYLHALLPNLEYVTVESLRDYSRRVDLEFVADLNATVPDDVPTYLWFILSVGGKPVYFLPQNVSDGTLRAFGVLLALFQCVGRVGPDVIPVVAIEEPEATLHPGAAGVLMDALQEASQFTQVLATTHSAELLDTKDLDPASLLAVEMVDGETVVGPVDDVSKSILRDRLATAGELLRNQHLRPQSLSEKETSGVDTDQ